jgi:hypothetical protein
MFMKIEDDGSMTPVYTREEDAKAERWYYNHSRVGRGSCGSCINWYGKCKINQDITSSKWCDGYKNVEV